LSQLQINCRVSSEVIAENIGLSASAVQRRVKRLREANVIVAEVAIVNSQYVTTPLTMLMGIEIERENYAVLQKLKRWSEKEARISRVYSVTGDVDAIAIAHVSSAKDYDKLSERLMNDIPQIKRISTNVVLDELKDSQSPML
jgi:DNA-binding Lrp family transcriptional regulator